MLADCVGTTEVLKKRGVSVDAGAALRRRARAHRRFGGLVVRCSGASRPGVCALPAGGHRGCRALCCGGRAAVEGFPWPGGVGGGQARGPLPWPAPGRCWSSCLEATQCNRRSLSRQGQGALRLPMAAPWVPALTPLTLIRLRSVNLLYAPPLRHVTSCCINRFQSTSQRHAILWRRKMTQAWAQRQAELLRDCIVSSNVFQHMVDRLSDFAVPYQHAPRDQADRRNVALYLAGLSVSFASQECRADCRPRRC